MSVTFVIMLILGTGVGVAHGVLMNKESERRELAQQFADDLARARANAVAAAGRDTDPALVLESGSEEVKKRILAEGGKLYGNDRIAV